MRILAFDIETKPLVAYTFSTFKTTITPDKIISDPEIMCFTAQWIDGPKPSKIMFYSEHHHGREEMLQQLWDLFDEADVLVGYNIKNFDIPWVHGEFIAAGLPAPSPAQTIDLYQTIKSATRWPSKKLAYVAPRLLDDSKVSHTGFEMWRGCMNGDEKAWRLMKRYAIRDTQLLKPLYEKLRPWIKNHPNMALDSHHFACPACGSQNVQRRGTARTNASVFQRYHCQDCGKWSRSATRQQTTELRNIAA